MRANQTGRVSADWLDKIVPVRKPGSANHIHFQKQARCGKFSFVKPWLKRPLRDYRAFLGTKTVWFLSTSVVSGLILFFVEFAFAYAIQVFFVAIGVSSQMATSAPAWLSAASPTVAILILAGLGVARACLQGLQSYLPFALEDIQKRLHRGRILDWAFSGGSASSTEIMSLCTHTVAYTGTMVGHLQRAFFYLTTSLALWLGMWFVSPKMTVGVTLVLAVLGVLMRQIDRAIRRIGDTVTRMNERLTTRLLNSIKNFLLMQIYGTLGRERDELDRTLDLTERNSLRFHRLASLKFISIQVAGAMLICSIAYSSGQYHLLVPAALLSYFYLFMRFVQSFAESVHQLASVGFYWPHFESLASWWARQAQERAASAGRNPDLTRVGRPLPGPPGWLLSSVGFRYADAERSVLDKLDLELKSGEALVITGASGVGKSTLLSILIGSLRPTSGRVELVQSGQASPISDEVRANLAASVGYVGSEPFLIEGSLRDNILYGINSIPDEATIQAALKKAECGFIAELAAGLNHRLTDQGQGLSAGQKQRLALARALVRQPKILILDEATSNLDEQTEARLITTLGSLKGTMTIVAVTHRLSLLKFADAHIELRAGNSS